MRSKKITFLFVALLVPGIIFIFLKIFGSNQFDVDVLYEGEMPDFTDDCSTSYSLPYRLPQSVIADVNGEADSAVVIHFGKQNATFLNRVRSRYADDPVGYRVFDKYDSTRMKCIFILEEPFDVALVDNRGRIRGQYNSTDREEVDRLITELAILIRKY